MFFISAPAPTLAPVETDAARLDRVADFLLQHGFGKQAERLSHIANEMRRGGQ
jgi:alpha-beta hydrolase superfamily lysophospholipase